MSERRPGDDDSLSRASYFAVALDVLATEGPGALTITELCARLGVTKGSFYHHFDGRQQFVESLLQYWETEHAARLIEISRHARGTHERMDLLKNMAVELPHDAEAAIRAWSSHDASVAKVQADVDALRRTHLVESYVAAGVTPERAEVLAALGMSVLAGMQMLSRPSDHEMIRRVFDEFERLMQPGAWAPGPS